MTFSCRSYIDALSAKFNECIARHIVCHSAHLERGMRLCNPRQYGWDFLPPSNEPGVKTAGHRTVSSSEAPRHT